MILPILLLAGCGAEPLTLPVDLPAAPALVASTCAHRPMPAPPELAAVQQRQRNFDAVLGQRTVLTITSNVDWDALLTVRWSHLEAGGGWSRYEELVLVPGRATVEAHADCAYGGLYQVELVGQGWWTWADYGTQRAMCW
jgi:hypothetical protein